MATQPTEQQRRWGYPAFILAGLIAMLALLSSGTAASERTPPVQPAVFAWVQEHPGQPVPLIVQHDGTASDLRSYVVSEGGVIQHDFTIVPALDVTVPANDVTALARQQDVTWVSLDAPVQSTGMLDLSGFTQAYPYAVNVDPVWSKGIYGDGVTIAVIDTGVADEAASDFLDDSGNSRVQWVTTNPTLAASKDGFGHGTHVAGLAAGYSTTTSPAGKYAGIAPRANVLAVRIADDQGNATVGDLLAGLQYVDDNRVANNIRVLNLSVTSSVAQSYKVDPIDAAVELLWFHGVTVVVAAGNLGSAPDAVSYPPANDPFVITVGAIDDMGTKAYGDDRLTSWSSRGVTQDGIAKPDLVAPGRGLIAPVSATSTLATQHPEAIVERAGNQVFFRMSGTSMSAPVVSGVVALVLQQHPDWTPGQLKAGLISTSRKVNGDNAALAPQAGQAISLPKPSTSSDNNLQPSYLLLAAAGVPEVLFPGIRWGDVTVNGIRWAGLMLDGIRWGTVDWNGIRWGSVSFDGIRWGSLELDGIRWSGIRWSAFTE